MGLFDSAGVTSSDEAIFKWQSQITFTFLICDESFFLLFFQSYVL